MSKVNELSTPFSHRNQVAVEFFQKATSCHQRGQLPEAERHYRAVLKADDRHFGAIHGLGLIRLQQGRHADAAPIFRGALKLNTNSAEAHHHLAIALTGLRRTQEAVEEFNKALAINPRFAEAHDSLGHTLQMLGRAEEAIPHHETALAIKPDLVSARNNLGNALRNLGRFEEAIAHYEKALELRPAYPDAHNNLGTALTKLGRHQAALAQFEKALAGNPNHVHAHINLGNALAALGRPQQAIAQYEKAIALDPRNVGPRKLFGHLLQQLGRLEEALAQYERAVVTAPADPEAHARLGRALLMLGRPEAAVPHYKQALALQPNLFEASSGLGTTLQALGRRDEAIRVFEQSIAMAPRKGSAYLNLAVATRLAADDPRFAAMQELARDIQSLDIESQICLRFALARVFADLGDHEESFQHLLEGNRLKRQRVVYDEASALESFDQVPKAFTAELLREKSWLGDPSCVPVFIVGMPRSGTTLIEQILASHPKAFGAGEVRDFPRLVMGIEGADGSQLREWVAALSGEQLRRLGESYVQAVRRLAPGAERIIDKLPANFARVGLIHLALPNARIIHIRRDPRDTALSCFSVLFAEAQEFSYDLAELGRFIRAYQALMEHWRQVLPQGVMLEVQYEDVVENLEGEARRIVAHCNLDWDDACLAFHKTQRSVLTASMNQVRQPIYRSSVGRWRDYERQLHPFLQALAGT
jgi:tetratricopeptide (TPR) repeat protein